MKQKPKKPPHKKSAARDNAAANIRAFMADHGLDDLMIQKDDDKIEVRSGSPGFYSSMPPAPAPPPPLSATSPAAPESNHVLIRSPMAGTFYRSSSPNADPYVKDGDAVTPNATVCVIEAMKVMNEIKAEVSGRIVKICVENVTSVEQGAALFEVDPAG